MGDDSLLRESPSVSCHSGKYVQLWPLFIVLLVVVVAGLPVFFLGLLYFTRVRGRPADLNDLALAAYESQHRLRFGILYEMFKTQYW